MIVHPNMVLSFNQRVVPLEVAIDKFGNKGAESIKTFFRFRYMDFRCTTIQSNLREITR